MITALRSLKEVPLLCDLEQQIKQIVEMVVALNRNTPLYNFVREDAPEDLVAGFDGKDHCEMSSRRQL
jgi:hypothetical protein